MTMARNAGRAGTAAAAALVLVMMLSAGVVEAQDHAHAGMAMPETGLRAELIRDIERLESRYLALAEAMTDHFQWRPQEGVRSTGEVFGHVAASNFMIAGIAGIDPPARYQGDEGRAALRAIERADPDEVMAALRHSLTHARHAIARTPDAELDTKIRLFGRDATKREALTLMVTHLHEHLGQSIAYARTNGVRPPWSGG